MQSIYARLATVAMLWLFAGPTFAQDSAAAGGEAPPQKVTLMGMLSEWMYPEAGFEGAETSDAAVTGVVASKSKAILTTTDSVDKVMDFYCERLDVDREGTKRGQKEGERITGDRSVLIQEIPSGGASPIYLIAIDAANDSTTLVVSRSAQGDVTRIAWSNYRQHRP